MSCASHPVGLWELGLSHPVSYDDPLPAIQIPDVRYEGHEWMANRNEYDAELMFDSSEVEAPVITGDDHGLSLNWEIPISGGSISLSIAIKGGNQAALEFSSQVTVPAEWMIRYLAWPRLRGFGDLADPEGDALLFPYNFGILRRNPLEEMDTHIGQYPGGGQWGQFISWMHADSGLYVGIRDGESHHTGLEAAYVEGAAPAPHKVIHWYLDQDLPPWTTANSPPLAERTDPAMQITARHWPTQGNSWNSPYPVVLQGFAGGWYEAAAIHREWALKQRWCRLGPLAERETQTAAADLDLWVCRYGFPPWELTPSDASAMLRAMRELRDYFGRPFGVHWYHWHAFNWHRNYPSHAPVVEGFAEAVKELQELGIVIMPYCQGRLLYRDRAAIDTERSHACIEANGQPYLEMYTKQDDWPLALCPHDSWSRQQWHEAARLLWRQYGVEGVYYDQISAMMPSLCYHRAHGHALGGGNQTWQGYDAVLANLETMKAEDPRRFLASECLTDAYMDRLDMFLSFVPPLEDYVPLWPAVYSGYTTTMGRSTPESIMADPQLMVICQGEQLLFGAQLGWMDERILKYPEAAAFLREAADLRGQLRSFLQHGTLLAPLTISTPGEPLTVTLPAALCGRKRDLVVSRPQVAHTAWQAPDGRRLLLLLNQSREDVNISIDLPDAWRTGPARWVGHGEAPPLASSLEVHVQPLSLRALVVG